MHILINFNNIRLKAKLNSSSTAKILYSALPFKKSVSRWGGEIYFGVEMVLPLEKKATSVLSIGDIAYWPGMGGVICVFFGKTPASSGEAPEAAGHVNIIGRISENSEALFSCNEGDLLHVCEDL